MLDKSSHVTLAPDAMARSMLVQRVVAYHLLKRTHTSSQNLYMFCGGCSGILGIHGDCKDPKDPKHLSGLK